MVGNRAGACLRGEPGTGDQAKSFYDSVDGGRRWSLAGRLPFGPGYIGTIAAGSPRRWLLGELRGTIEYTADGGRRWHAAAFAPPAAPVEGWGEVWLTGRLDGVAVPSTLNGSALAFTTDAGRRWSEVHFPGGR